MRNLSKVLAVLLAVVMLVSVFAGCAKKSDTQEGKTYIIYSDNSFAPFEYLDESSNSGLKKNLNVGKTVNLNGQKNTFMVLI